MATTKTVNGVTELPSTNPAMQTPTVQGSTSPQQSGAGEKISYNGKDLAE